ncbi:hypothetical protein SCLCIDRAFT_979429 [Scleroderma citrinum Foug A]|uniref:Uncharacterized protein n=1 Tax=Scleroderma citrinum Foug A TaxID=1036808 RepID=A0A0C2ZDQ7_9AGAM|nr:hypothetical protein SCLCIDRAFT_979429 [Scleroderma citrinum Foug A]
MTSLPLGCLGRCILGLPDGRLGIGLCQKYLANEITQSTYEILDKLGTGVSARLVKSGKRCLGPTRAISISMVSPLSSLLFPSPRDAYLKTMASSTLPMRTIL